jgi:hypothetical protein
MGARRRPFIPLHDIESTMPFFEVVGGTVTATALRCPRDGCGTALFTVDARVWAAEHRSVINPEVVVNGRACPYCFAASKVPEDLRRRFGGPGGTMLS